MIKGISIPYPERPKLAISHMTDLFTLDGGLPPPDMRDENGNMKELPPMPPPPPVRAAIIVENNQLKDGEPSALHGGIVGEDKAKNLRITAYEGVGGVHVVGGKYTIEDSTISLNSGDGEAQSSTGVSVTGKGELTITDSVIYVSGMSAGATTADEHSTLRVKNCTLISQGSPYGDDASPGRKARRSPPAPLELGGNCRTHITLDHSESYFEHSTIITDGWAALSTDTSHGYVYLEANNCKVVATKGGYGIYSDKFCHVALNNCDVDADRHGLIIDGEADAVFRHCKLECGAYFAMVHCSGGPPSQVGTISAEDCSIHSKNELFTIRSENALIDMDGCNITSDTGILIHSKVNPDPMSPVTNGRQVFGIRATFRNMELQGSIIHEDPDRDMTITLESAALTGALKSVYLCMGQGSTWFASEDSSITLRDCQVDPSQFDAAEGTTIECFAHEDAVYTLASGGRLNVRRQSAE